MRQLLAFVAALIISESFSWGAQQAYSQTLVLNPKDRAAVIGLAESQRLATLAHVLPVPSGYCIYRVAELPDHGGPNVLVVIGKPEKRNSNAGFPSAESVGDAKVLYFERQGDKFTKRDQLTLPEGSSIDCARIWVRDLAHTGKPQVLLVYGWESDRHANSYVEIWDPQAKTLRPVLSAGSYFPPELVDLDQDGKQEVQVLNPPSPQAHPRKYAWSDIYRYDGSQYVRVNYEYPKLAQAQLDRMLALENELGEDEDLFDHIAQAYRDVRQKDKAAEYAARAKRFREEARGGR